MKKKTTLFLSVILTGLLVACQEGGSSSALNSSSALSSSSLTSSISSEDSSSTSVVLPSSSESIDPEVYPESITFYSLNDTHGAINQDPATDYPGMAQLAYEIGHDSNYSSSSVLLSSGDMFQGSAMSNISEGMAMLDVMSGMGFEAMAIGNHEFDWGLEKLANLASKAEFPFLGINIQRKSTGEIPEFLAPSTTFNRGKAKIGVIGSIMYGIESSISATVIKDISFLEDYSLVTEEAERLKLEEKCDIVLVSTHQGPSNGSRYLSSSYIDGVFGGHDHMVYRTIENNKFFMESGCNSEHFAKMTFEYQDGKYVVSQDPSLSYVANIYRNPMRQDEYISYIISTYQEYIDIISSTVVGKRDGEIVRYSSSHTSKPYGSAGSFVCEAILYYSQYINPVEGCIASFHNTGGIRANWLNTGKTPDENGLYDITIGDLYTMSPFDNQVQYVDVTGERVIRAMKDHYHSMNLTTENYNYYINGEEIDRDKIYRVVTIDYLTTKSSSSEALGQGEKGGNNLNGEVAFIRDVISAYIQAKEVIHVQDYHF